MIASIALCLAALAMSIPAQQQPSLFPVFILDSDPVSLEGSFVAVNPIPTQTYQSIVTLKVDCPRSASPDNDACRALGIYPAEVYHTQGSVYGGTFTAAGPTTTTWSCALGGSYGGPTPNLDGTCVRTLVDGAAGSTRLETTVLNSCYVMEHSVPVLVTAGAEKLPPAYYQTVPVPTLLSAYSSVLESMGCPLTTTTAMSTTSSTSTAAVTSSSIGGSQASTGASPTQTQPSTTAGSSASPSESPNGVSGREASLILSLGAAILLSMCLA